MDDFIDDSDAKIDISAEIRNIFGYDRRKFNSVLYLYRTTAHWLSALTISYEQALCIDEIRLIICSFIPSHCVLVFYWIGLNRNISDI